LFGVALSGGLIFPPPEGKCKDLSQVGKISRKSASSKGFAPTGSANKAIDDAISLTVRGSGPALRATLLATTFLTLGILAAVPAWAGSPLPRGGQFVAGSGLISGSGTGLTVGQSSTRAIIDWQSFSIGQGAKVQFNNGSGATLNRITGGTPSQILGTLSATGSVYLINPNGIVIGKSGVVSTGGSFVASTLDIGNAMFMAGGDLTFRGASQATVLNQGSIASGLGDVYLFASSVENDGAISAPQGTAGLGAGQQVLLKPAAAGTQHVFIQADGGNATNKGTIAAAQAELAAAGGNVYALAGNNGGVIAATGVTTHDGAVYLTAGDGGSASVDGTVSAQSAFGAGGAITVAAASITVAPTAALDASAKATSGAGGAISVKAGKNLSFQGRASARGGAAGGNGGTVETSAVSHVDFTGARIDTSAPAGKTGNWLVDPDDLTIDTAAAATIDGDLATTNVMLQTTSGGTSGPGNASSGGSGNIIVNSPLNWSSGNTLTFSAYKSLLVDANITVAGGGGVVITTNTGNVGGDYSFAPSTSLSFTSGSGSGATLNINGSSYALLYSAADLQAINASDTALSANYALANGLDLTGVTWTPIGVASGSAQNSGAGYDGSFTGLGHTVSNLTLVGTFAYVGLFGDSSGTIRDIGIVNPHVSATGTTLTFGHTTLNIPASIVGALLGENDTGVVLNAFATGGTISAASGDGTLGGLVGENNGIINNAYATTTVAAPTKSGLVGGLVGINDLHGTITNAYATGAVSAGSNTQEIGGLAGVNEGIIANSHATGSVSGANTAVSPALNAASVGGLVGQNAGGSITDSYATGAVFSGAGSAEVGGLVGFNFTSTNGNGVTTLATIANSYASGTVTGGTGVQLFGGLVGYTSGPISNSYATGAVTVGSGSSFVGGLVGQVNGTGATAGSITSAYATGIVTVGSGSTSVGALVGQDVGTTTSGYIDISTTGVSTGFTDATGLSTAALQAGLPAGFDPSVWGIIAGKSYPYLLGIYPSAPQVVSGTALSAANAPVAGGSVALYGGGSALGYTTSTGADGYYNMLLPSGALAGSGPAVGATLVQSGGASVAAASLLDGTALTSGVASGLNFILGDIVESTTATSYSAMAAPSTVFGSTAYGTIQTALPTASIEILAQGAFTVDQTISSAGQILVTAGGALTISPGGAISSTATGNAVVLSTGGAFTNDDGSGALATANGNWLIWSQNQGNDTLDGLAAGFKQYAATYGTTGVAQATGNGLLYTEAPTLTIGLAGTVVSKTYDGTTAAALTAGNYSVSGTAGDDTITVTSSGASYGGKDAGTGLLVTAGGLGFTAFDGAIPVYGYTLSATSASASIGTITPKALTVGGLGAASSKTYDAGTGAVVTGNATLGSSEAVGTGSAGDGLAYSGDTVDFVGTATGTYNSKDVADATTVTFGGLTSSSGDYTLVLGTQAATISRANLTVSGLAASNKTYDTALGAPLTGTATVTALSNDRVSLTGTAAGSFADKNVGRGKSVTVSGLTLGGTDAGNYTLVEQPGLTANIAAAELIVSGLSATSRTYDTTMGDILSGTATVAALGDDSVSLTGTAAGSFADKNVGTAKSVTVSGLTLGGTDAGNYTLVEQPGLTANIAAAELIVSGLSATSRTYDTTMGDILSGTATVAALGDDSVSLNGTAAGSFADKNAGIAKSVTVGGLTLGGTDAGNYTLVEQPGLTASIAAANLIVSGLSANNRIYDATTGDILTGIATVAALGSDSVSLSGVAAGSFADKNAGMAKSVTVSGLTLGGTDAGNYTLVEQSGLAANISAAKLIVSGLGATSRTYDTTTGDMLTGAATVAALGHDSVSLSGTAAGSFADKNVGTAKSVTVGGLTLGGTDAGNYILVEQPGLTANITPAAINVALTGTVAKTYDATNSATLNAANYVVGGLLAGDVAAVNTPTAGLYADATAGTGKRVSVTGLALAGEDAGNYALSATEISASIGTVNQAPLTISVLNAIRPIGVPDPNYIVRYIGLLGGDTSAVVSGLQVGSADTPVSPPGTYAIQAADGFAVNYRLSYLPGSLTVTPAPVAIGSPSITPPPVVVTSAAPAAGTGRTPNPAGANTTAVTSISYGTVTVSFVQAAGSAGTTSLNGAGPTPAEDGSGSALVDVSSFNLGPADSSSSTTP
jgi:filamentous hemagglutinin family protein